MTRRAYRIVRSEFARTGFSSEGVRLYGGRWNSPGVAVAYAAESLSLAQLELLVRVHSRDVLHRQFSLIIAEFPVELATPVSDLGDLPAGWDSPIPCVATQALGDRWVKEHRSVVLSVPSVVTRDEFNYLFDPGHPDFRRVTVRPAVAFAFDHRLSASSR